VKTPTFESTQVTVGKDGEILGYQKSFGDWLGLRAKEGNGKKILNLLTEGEPSWSEILPANLGKEEQECFLPFLENGNIRHSVNFPDLILEPGPGVRLAVTNRNIPKMLGQVLSVLADADINVIDMLNKSRDELAYNLLDLEEEPTEAAMARIRALEGVVNARLVRP